MIAHDAHMRCSNSRRRTSPCLALYDVVSHSRVTWDREWLGT